MISLIANVLGMISCMLLWSSLIRSSDIITCGGCSGSDLADLCRPILWSFCLFCGYDTIDWLMSRCFHFVKLLIILYLYEIISHLITISLIYFFCRHMLLHWILGCISTKEVIQLSLIRGIMTASLRRPSEEVLMLARCSHFFHHKADLSIVLAYYWSNHGQMRSSLIVPHGQ